MAHRPPPVQFDIGTLGIIPLLTDSSQPDWPSAIPPATERVLKYWGCDPALPWSLSPHATTATPGELARADGLGVHQPRRFQFTVC